MFIAGDSLTTIHALRGKSTDVSIITAVIKTGDILVPKIGLTIMHRSTNCTATNIRLGPAAVFFQNIVTKVNNIINKSCIKCREQSPTFQEVQKAHHALQPGVPWQQVSLDIIGPYLVKAATMSRTLHEVWSLIILCNATNLITHTSGHQHCGCHKGFVASSVQKKRRPEVSA